MTRPIAWIKISWQNVKQKRLRWNASTYVTLLIIHNTLGAIVVSLHLTFGGCQDAAHEYFITHPPHWNYEMRCVTVKGDVL